MQTEVKQKDIEIQVIIDFNILKHSILEIAGRTNEKE